MTESTHVKLFTTNEILSVHLTIKQFIGNHLKYLTLARANII